MFGSESHRLLAGLLQLQTARAASQQGRRVESFVGQKRKQRRLTAAESDDASSACSDVDVIEENGAYHCTLECAIRERNPTHN